MLVNLSVSYIMKQSNICTLKCTYLVVFQLEKFIMLTEFPRMVYWQRIECPPTPSPAIDHNFIHMHPTTRTIYEVNLSVVSLRSTGRTPRANNRSTNSELLDILTCSSRSVGRPTGWPNLLYDLYVWLPFSRRRNAA